MRLFRLIPLPMVALVVAACSGGSDGTTEPPVKQNVTYQGIFASGLERGTITLVSSSPATGSLSVNGKAAVALTGSFNTSSGTFSLTGSGYTATGTAGTPSAPAGTAPASAGPALGSSATGTLTGSVTGPDITGTATLAAKEAPTGTALTRYCGVFTGDDSGMMDVITLGGDAVGTHAGMGGGFVLSGTVSGATVTLTATGRHPDGTVNTVTAVLTIAGTTLSGTGSSTLYPTERVNITTSSTACASIPQTGPYTSYVGWVWNNGYTGLLTLVPGSPATGSLTWNGGATVALTGTYNATTGVFSMTGGVTTITATATDGVLSGSASGLPPTTSSGAVRGLGSSAATPVTRYCGQISGGKTGKVIFGQAGNVLAGIVVFGGTTLALNGTAGGAWVYLPAGTQMFLAATGTPSSYSGTWTHVDDTAGTWSATPGC